MKNGKFALLFGAVMVCAMMLLFSGAEAASSGNCGADGANVTWSLDNDGVLTISGTGAMEDYSYSTYSHAPWYNNRQAVEMVVIENSVTSIGAYAFYYCTNLTSITIPDSVTSIGASVFYYCTNFTSITIPDSVTSIGAYAFSYCTNLTSITIPDSVTSIGYHAFSYCTNLTSITIPNSVTSIGDEAFLGCTGLTSVTIHGSVHFGRVVFKNCRNLMIHIDSVLAWLEMSFDYSIYEDTSDTFGCAYRLYIGNEELTSITIPDSVTSIGYQAFSYCTNLTSITIPDSVTSIGDEAFLGCTGLTSVTIHGSAHFSFDVFRDCRNLQIHIDSVLAWLEMSYNDEPGSPFGYDYHLYIGNEELTSISIPNGVTRIGPYAFSDCAGLTSITIPDSVTSIGFCAFSGCNNLREVHINSVRSWLGIHFEEWDDGEYVYYGLSTNPCYLAHHLYLGNNELTSITIPNDVTHIEALVFAGCSKLTDIFIPENITSIGYYAFESCTGLKTITMPDSITRIGESAFSGCSGLTSVTISNVVTSIEEATFEDCVALTSITIPDSVTSIGYDAFSGCTGLTSITIPDSVTSIGSYAFSGCTGLTSITISDGMTRIGSYTFLGCTGLTNITIPDSVTNIDKYAFYKCSSLTMITCQTCCSYAYNWALEKEFSAEALHHQNIITIPMKPATCIETGLTESSYCSVCDTVLAEQQTIPATGHTAVTDPAVVPTCTQTGLTEGSHCAVCHAILLAQEVVPVKDHTSVTDPEVAPTCTESGLTAGSHCSRCGEVLVAQQVVPAVGHTPVTDPAVMPTCTETGLTEGIHCSICHAVLEAQVVVPVLEHIPALDAAVPPTETRPGLTEGSHCAVCGTVLTEQLPIDPLLWGIEVNGGEVTITRYYGSDELRSIPEQLEGKPVTAIASGAFGSANLPTCVYIPQCVRNISPTAFDSAVTVYCEEYSEADYWADEAGYPYVYTDDTTAGTFYIVTLPGDFRLERGQTRSFETAVWPLTGRETVAWTSSDPDSASVKDGVVTAKPPGTAVITLTVGGITETVTVTVFANPESFILTDEDGDTGDLYVITKETARLYVRDLYPAGADLTLDWTSSAVSVAVVSGEGVITAKHPGTAVIIATAQNGVMASRTVIVCYPVKSVSFGALEYSVCVQGTVRVAAYAVTQDRTYENKLVTFTSSDESVATIDRDGFVTGVSLGEAVIMADAGDGIVASCTVTVREPNVLTLPASFTVIESEAFAGLANVDIIVIPAGIVQIAPDAFDNGIVLCVPSEAWAQWAEENGYRWIMQ